VVCTITGSGDITGTEGDDVICGSDGPDRIAGLGGNDVIFGFGGDDQLPHLVGISGLLGEWWEALDTLDDKIRNRHLTESARDYLQEQIRTWFDTRHRFLLALARSAGAKVSQPDANAGVVQTSGIGALGAYGYHPDYDR